MFTLAYDAIIVPALPAPVKLAVVWTPWIKFTDPDPLCLPTGLIPIIWSTEPEPVNDALETLPYISAGLSPGLGHRFAEWFE